MKKINLGIIGLGNVVLFQLKALKFNKDICLTAFCDPFGSNKKSHYSGVPIYKDMNKFLEKDLDAVLIATPNSTHYDICKRVLKHNKNVLLEKPATTDIKEFRDLIKRAEERNLSLVIAFHAAFARDLEWFINNYESTLKDELGEINGFYCQFYDPYIQEGSLLSRAKSLQGSWMDSGVNAISVIERLFNLNKMCVEVSRLSKIKGIEALDISSIVELTFETEHLHRRRGYIETNWTLGHNYKATKLYFDGTDESIILDHSREWVIKVDGEGHEEVLVDLTTEQPRLVNHYVGVFRDFVQHITNKTHNLDKALRIHQLLFYPYCRGGKSCVVK